MNTEIVKNYIAASNDNAKKFNDYMEWLSYYIGFSGCGTTAMDIKPDFPMPTDIPPLVGLTVLGKAIEEASVRAMTFRRVIAEQLGESWVRWTPPTVLWKLWEECVSENLKLGERKQAILDRLEVIAKRMKAINEGTLWVHFKSFLTGEFSRLTDESHRLFNEFDEYNFKQSGVVFQRPHPRKGYIK
jgi:hypothetical protein